MNPITQNIITRRSCRSYTAEAVPDEIINQIVEAGLYAASGRGKQTPVVIVVKDKSIRDKLSALNSKYDPGHRDDPFYGAPVVLCVLAPKNSSTAVEDGSLVIGNMMLAAHSLGMGSCWIHRAKEVFDDPEGKPILNNLGLSDEYIGIGNCVIGHIKNINPDIIPRKDGRVFYI